MNKATTHFIGAHGRDAEKAERAWNKKPEADCTWVKFKQHWKEEIHMWSFLALRDEERAGKVWAPETKLRSMQGDVDALQVKNRNHQQENHSLRTQQFNIQQALQAK